MIKNWFLYVSRSITVGQHKFSMSVQLKSQNVFMSGCAGVFVSCKDTFSKKEVDCCNYRIKIGQ